MGEPSAYVYRERGRVFVRMELAGPAYVKMMAALYNRDQSTYFLLEGAEREQHDRSDIFERFNDAPPIGSAEIPPL